MMTVRAIAVAAGIAWIPAQAAVAAVPSCTAGPAELTLRSANLTDADDVRYRGLSGQARRGSKPVQLCSDTRYRIVPVDGGCTVVVPVEGTADAVHASITRQLLRRQRCPKPTVSVVTDVPGPGGMRLPSHRIVPRGSIDTRYRREVVVMVNPSLPLHPQPPTTKCTGFVVPNAAGMTVAALKQAYLSAGCQVTPQLSDGRLLDDTVDHSQALVDNAWPPLATRFGPGKVEPVWFLRPQPVPRHAPNVTGMDFDTARRVAREAGFSHFTAFRDGEAVDATGGDLVIWQYPAPNEATGSDAIVVQSKPKTIKSSRCIVGPVTQDETLSVAALEHAYRPTDPQCRVVKAHLVADGRLLDRDGIDTDAWIVTASMPARTTSFSTATETPIWIVRRYRPVAAPDLVKGTVADATRAVEALGLPPPLVLADDRLVAAAGAGTSVVAEQQPAAGSPVADRIVVRVLVAKPADDNRLSPPVVLAAGGGAGIAGGELVRRLARRSRDGRSKNSRLRDGGSKPNTPAGAATKDLQSRRVRARPDLPPPVKSATR